MSTSHSLFARSSRPRHALRQLPAALGCSAGLLLAACGPSQPTAGAGGPPGGAMPPMPVTVRSVKLQTVPVLVDAVGQAEGSKDVDVRARVGGLVEHQLYTEGDRVRAGAPLFAIERAPYEIAVATAKAALAQEQAKLEQTQREARRLKPLAEMQAISQREADDAITAQRSAEASVAAAQARVRDAELNLSYTAVSAPIAGISGRAEKSQGSLVSAADGLLTKIVQTDPIWVRFSFSESELAQLKSGQGAAAVRLLSADGRPLGVGGKLNFTGSSVDARLGTVGLRAAFANPELAVLPGQFVKAQVQVGQQKAWLVPQAAVVSGEQGKMVWTVQGGKAAPTPVEVGGWIGQDWAVLKGLKDGDQVVTDNLIKMRPGAAVQAKDAASAASAASR
jgi:membrane fusion protein (multidrug efflux system)